MKVRINKYILLVAILLMVNKVQSQAPCPPNTPGCGQYDELPIDGGLFYLIIAGVVFGVYETRKRKKL